jgi:RNA polymerase sigma-70 factor (ECF subfamily)
VPIEALADGAEGTAPPSEADPLAGARLRRLLLELEPDARAVMLLRFQEDLDPADIADVLAMSVNTVKSHLRRSLQWLRAQLAGEDDGS